MTPAAMIYCRNYSPSGQNDIPSRRFSQLALSHYNKSSVKTELVFWLKNIYNWISCCWIKIGILLQLYQLYISDTIIAVLFCIFSAWLLLDCFSVVCCLECLSVWDIFLSGISSWTDCIVNIYTNLSLFQFLLLQISFLFSVNSIVDPVNLSDSLFSVLFLSCLAAHSL